jgi:neutral trehalase
MNPHAPESISTSGITQPPILAEAVLRVADSLKKHERKSWLKLVYPNLARYHQWLYADRDPHNEGLVLQIHPWETGLDNTPPWMRELHDHQLPLWIQAVKSMRLSPLFNLFRNDTKIIPAHERMTTIDALALYSVQRRLRRKNYDIKRILAHSLFAIEDVSFNAILLRNNQLLRDIAEEIKQPIDEQLAEDIARAESAFEQLWDPYSSQYYSREFVSHRLLKQPSIGTLIALYSGTIPQKNADQLVKTLEDEQMFGPPYPVPSVPVGSDWFQEHTYWQGPTWINANWLIIDGLERYGYKDHADALKQSTIEMLKRHGCFEYFSPLDGSPAGAQNFSWSAALAIDLLNQ